ncbi:hypothetical protein [Fodinibius sp.]|uniref:hypothetical protein n=1 Tax=Fodinibius sp. TaxID=1872440 RepID=UPI002ACD584F|nr:hypothetical protein [Fodinibius sp.]MDZ7660145.1 hypothetical protein [Fodinibius sp.]
MKSNKLTIVKLGHDFYAYLNREESKAYVEKLFIYLAFSLFLIHLLVIFIADSSVISSVILKNVNTNYLSALYTPFSIILVYEVYFMILALPLSFTESIKKQYEIISLIIIRRVFKDLSDFSGFSEVWDQTDQFLDIIFDLCGGLILFLLVGVFYHASKNRRGASSSTKLNKFIRFKEFIALILAVLLIFLAAFAFGEWVNEVILSTYSVVDYDLELESLFFDDLFTVMIFTDVLIFIASFLYSKRYEVLIRNAGFIVSTILIRISLTVKNEYGVLVAIGAVLTGIAVQLIYRYFSWLDINDEDRIYPTQ